MELGGSIQDTQSRLNAHSYRRVQIANPFIIVLVILSPRGPILATPNITERVVVVLIS
jgi:hypothetical protein